MCQALCRSCLCKDEEYEQAAVWWRGQMSKRISKTKCQSRRESSLWKEQWEGGEDRGQFYSVVCGRIGSGKTFKRKGPLN